VVVATGGVTVVVAPVDAVAVEAVGAAGLADDDPHCRSGTAASITTAAAVALSAL
jgi:hypothetical protein